MKIVVCTKYVPDTAIKTKVTADGKNGFSNALHRLRDQRRDSAPGGHVFFEVRGGDQ